MRPLANRTQRAEPQGWLHLVFYLSFLNLVSILFNSPLDCLSIFNVQHGQYIVFNVCFGQAPLAVKSSGVNQSPRVITAQVGQTVILKCFCGEDSVTFFSWYQQKLGGKPVIISSRMRHDTEASISPSFKGRFQVDSRERINHLTISDLLPSDSAVYYCGILEFNLLQFGEGTFLHVRMPLSNIQVIVYQPGVSPVGPGDSVELGCEVRGKKCEGEQSFYFFRQTTDHPVTIHPMEGNCVNEARSRKCTLTYSIQSVNSSDEGVYYCALASCGQIMLGNGAQVQLSKQRFFFSPFFFVAKTTKGIAPDSLEYCIFFSLSLIC